LEAVAIAREKHGRKRRRKGEVKQWQ